MIALAKMLSLQGLPAGLGRSAAARVWLALWSRVRWPKGKGQGKPREVWAGDDALAKAVGSDPRTVRRAIALLRVHGRVTTRMGRPRGARKCVRVITLIPEGDGGAVFRLPTPTDVAALQARIACVGPDQSGDGFTLHRSPVAGARPGPALALALALLALASADVSNSGIGERPIAPIAVAVSLADLRAMTGVARSKITQRLERLEAAGIVRRFGEQWRHGFEVMPVQAQAQASTWIDALPHALPDARPVHPMRACLPGSTPWGVEPGVVAAPLDRVPAATEAAAICSRAGNGAKCWPASPVTFRGVDDDAACTLDRPRTLARIPASPGLGVTGIEFEFEFEPDPEPWTGEDPEFDPSLWELAG